MDTRLHPGATAALGQGTHLPVVTIDDGRSQVASHALQKADRRHLRVLKRAAPSLTILRSASIHGAATVIENGRPLLGYTPLILRIKPPTGPEFSLHGEANVRGHLVSGPFGGEMTLSVEASQRHHGFGHGWVTFNREPATLRQSLRNALMSALAGDTWMTVTDTLEAGQSVRLHRFGAFDAFDELHAISLSGPAGDVVAHVNHAGHVLRLFQYVNGRPIPDSGAFGRYLREEFLESLEVDDFHDVFGPFMAALRDQAATAFQPAAITMEKTR